MTYITHDFYRGYKLVYGQKGVAFRWHVYSPDGTLLTALGYRSKARARRAVEELTD